MTFNTILSMTLIAAILVANNVFAQPEEIPPDVFEAQPGGYLYADYPGVFDVAEGDEARGDGITIEMWVYFTEIPPERQSRHWEHWALVAKPASYFISAAGRPLEDASGDPEGHTKLIFAVEDTEEGCCSRGEGWRSYEPGEFPLKRWLHIAYQLVVKKDGTHRTEFIDRFGEGRSRFSGKMGRTEAPLFIGGAPTVTFENDEWGTWNTDFFGNPILESMKGYIDDIRITKGWRYGPGNIRPQRKFRVEERTIALWRFEEGPGAPFYRDSSRNGYTLFPGGSLPVQPLATRATTWGSLKRNTF